jgi:hypothetical protein
MWASPATSSQRRPGVRRAGRPVPSRWAPWGRAPSAAAAERASARCSGNRWYPGTRRHRRCGRGRTTATPLVRSSQPGSVLDDIDRRQCGLHLRVHGRHHRAADETLEVQLGALPLPDARGCTGGYGLPASAKGETMTGQVAIRRFRQRLGDSPASSKRTERTRRCAGTGEARGIPLPYAAPPRPGARAAMTPSMSLRTGGSSPVSPVRTPGCPGQGGKPDRSVC